ncbi:MAG TPA: alkyl hydroperoxide reductase, partial [Gemmatimonadetes bacterium]|nr:alkyl hydroperoxide reductase [Gemmatimonadota bacterium]
MIDLGNEAARKFGLTFKLPDDLREVYLNGLGLDLSLMNGDESWELAIPATFVIDMAGTI